jgi:hypothetical protein
MKNNKWFLSGVISVWCSLCLAQTIERQVIASGGGYALVGDAHISTTVGEVVITTQTGQGQNIELTQGFQQGLFKTTAIWEAPTGLWRVDLFPNPASTRISILLNTEYQWQDHIIEIVDLTARPMYKGKMSDLGNPLRQDVDVSEYANGGYLLLVRSLTGLIYHRQLFTIMH